MNWCGSVLLSVDVVIEGLDESISGLDIPGLVPFKTGPVGLVLTACHTTHKKSSSIHTSTFFHNCNNILNSFLMSYDLPADFFSKNLCRFVCSV